MQPTRLHRALLVLGGLIAVAIGASLAAAAVELAPGATCALVLVRSRYLRAGASFSAHE